MEDLKPCPYQTFTPPDNGTACKVRYKDECKCANTAITLAQLLPCPICGSESRDVKFWNCRIEYDVQCKDCGYKRKARFLGPAHHYTNDWNNRPIEDALRADLARKDELIAALREVVKAHNNMAVAESIREDGFIYANRNPEFDFVRCSEQLMSARARLAEVEEEKP